MGITSAPLPAKMITWRGSAGAKTGVWSVATATATAVTTLGILCMGSNSQRNTEEGDCGKAEISICGFHIFYLIGNLYTRDEF